MKDVNLGCFLSVEGILVDDVYGFDTILSIHDALFCVHLQRQYSASRELNAFLDQYGMDVKNISDESELKYLQALEVRAGYALLPLSSHYHPGLMIHREGVITKML